MFIFMGNIFYRISDFIYLASSSFEHVLVSSLWAFFSCYILEFDGFLKFLYVNIYVYIYISLSLSFSLTLSLSLSIYIVYIYMRCCHQHQLYSHLPPIMKTIQVRRTRNAGHCWRSRDELINDVLLWTPTHGRAKAGWPARTYIQQLCEDMRCSPEDLPEAMNDREKWRKRVRDIRASSTTWWWWYIYIYIYICCLSSGENKDVEFFYISGLWIMVWIMRTSPNKKTRETAINIHIRGACDKFPDFFRIGI